MWPTAPTAASGRAAVCREFDSVRAILGQAGDAHVVDRLVAAAKANRPIARELDDVDTALVRAGVAGGLRGITSRLTDHSRLLGARRGRRPRHVRLPRKVAVTGTGPRRARRTRLPDYAVLGPKLVWKSS